MKSNLFAMEHNAGKVEMYLSAYLDGRADHPTKQMIEAWLGDKQNLPAFYEFLLRFESNNPKIDTDAEMALLQCKARIFQTSNGLN